MPTGLLTSYLDPELAPYVAQMLAEEEDLLSTRFELAVMKAAFRALQQDHGVDEEKRIRLLDRLARTIQSMVSSIRELEEGKHHYLHVTVTGTLIQAFAEIGRRYITDPRDRELFTRELESAIRRSLRTSGTSSRALMARALSPFDNLLTVPSEAEPTEAEASAVKGSNSGPFGK